MKNILSRFLIFAVLLLGIAASAQVIINADASTAKTKPSSNTSVLLEFGNDNDKGIIMPYVESLPANPTPGTILFYANPNADISVPPYINPYEMYYYDESGEWNSFYTRYSEASADDIATITSVQAGTTENTDARVIIGNATSNADGILVLESDSKAMILPIVDNLNNIKSPSIGMIVYLDDPNDPDGPYLAVYGGTIWSLWQPTTDPDGN